MNSSTMRPKLWGILMLLSIIAGTIATDPGLIYFLPPHAQPYVLGISGLLTAIFGNLFVGSVKPLNLTGGTVPATSEAFDRLTEAAPPGTVIPVPKSAAVIPGAGKAGYITPAGKLVLLLVVGIVGFSFLLPVLTGCSAAQQAVIKQDAANVLAKIQTAAADPVVQADAKAGLTAAGKITVAATNPDSSVRAEMWTWGNFADSIATGKPLTAADIDADMAKWGLSKDTAFGSEAYAILISIIPQVNGNAALAITWMGILASAARDSSGYVPPVAS